MEGRGQGWRGRGKDRWRTIGDLLRPSSTNTCHSMSFLHQLLLEFSLKHTHHPPPTSLKHITTVLSLTQHPPPTILSHLYTTHLPPPSLTHTPPTSHLSQAHHHPPLTHTPPTSHHPSCTSFDTTSSTSPTLMESSSGCSAV